MGKRKYFDISFPEISHLCLKAIVKYKEGGMYSDTWLREKVKEMKNTR